MSRNYTWKCALAPADKVANNVVVVWKMYYINTLKQELGTAKTYEQNFIEEKSVVDGHRCHMAESLVYLLMRIIASFLRYTGYQNFIKKTL